MSTEAKITFEDHPTPLDPRVISDYLYLISGILEAANGRGIEIDVESDAGVERAQELLKSLSPSEWNNYFSNRDNPKMSVQRISHESPLDIFMIVASCSLGAFTLAMILSGGQIKIQLAGETGLKAKLPPIGDGIKKLREALGLEGRDRQIGFAIQEITITLNKEEYDFLMTELSGQGGFQHFMAKLQAKVNKSTRTLTLSVEDLDRIQKYRANPSTGGFQGRYNKIFKRHLEGVIIDVEPIQSSETVIMELPPSAEPIPEALLEEGTDNANLTVSEILRSNGGEDGEDDEEE